MAYNIEEIEGIGPANAEKLAAADIKTTEALLASCSSKAGRKKVAETTGVGEKTILRWTNMADLMRISGVGSEYSELLEAAGVDTVKELRNRNADNLATAMANANDSKNLTRAVPSAKVVAGWIEKAKELPPAITY